MRCGGIKPKTNRASLNAALVFLVFTVYFSSVEAAEVLLVLEYAEKGKKVSTEIKNEIGTFFSPYQNKSQVSWTIKQGEAVQAKSAPVARQIDFYQRNGREYELVCTVELKYFEDKKNLWLPRYRINQEMFFVRDGDKWKPLNTVEGIPSLIQHTSTQFPNMEGYYSSFDFGLTTGPIAIDAWKVAVMVSPFSPYP
jgi:hypothetical protein